MGTDIPAVPKTAAPGLLPKSSLPYLPILVSSTSLPYFSASYFAQLLKGLVMVAVAAKTSPSLHHQPGLEQAINILPKPNPNSCILSPVASISEPLTFSRKANGPSISSGVSCFLEYEIFSGSLGTFSLLVSFNTS